MSKEQSTLGEHFVGRLLDLDEVVKAVFIGGDCYSKYCNTIKEQYGLDEEERISRFLNELFPVPSFERRRVTDTFALQLKYLGKENGLSEKSVEEIVRWQRLVFNSQYQYRPFVIFIVANNASMKALHPLRCSKSDYIENCVCDFVSSFRDYQFDYWNNLTLAVISYAEFAEVNIGPIGLQDLNEHAVSFSPKENQEARISCGLEAALKLIQLYNAQSIGQTIYMVLVSDGEDEAPEETNKTLDIIKQKWNIEFYSYFVETLGHSDTINTNQANFYDFIGGVSLEPNLVSRLDWWLTRDMTISPKYTQEGYYIKVRDKLFRDSLFQTTEI